MNECGSIMKPRISVGETCAIHLKAKRSYTPAYHAASAPTLALRIRAAILLALCNPPPQTLTQGPSTDPNPPLRLASILPAEPKSSLRPGQVVPQVPLPNTRRFSPPWPPGVAIPRPLAASQLTLNTGSLAKQNKPAGVSRQQDLHHTAVCQHPSC